MDDLPMINIDPRDWIDVNPHFEDILTDSIFTPRNERGDENDNTITGGLGNDSLYGDFGNDSIQGSSGNDLLYGQQGNDSLDGGDGKDSLDGYNVPLLPERDRVQYDILTGGGEADLFILGRADANYYYSYYLGEGHATITDFNREEGDKIQVVDFVQGVGFFRYELKNNAEGTQILLGEDLIANVEGVPDLSYSDFVLDSTGFTPPSRNLPEIPEFPFSVLPEIKIPIPNPNPCLSCPPPGFSEPQIQLPELSNPILSQPQIQLPKLSNSLLSKPQIQLSGFML